MGQKQSTPDNNVNDPMKDLTATAGQGRQSGNQQSGQQQSNQQSGQQQGNQQSQQSGRQQQGSQQSGQQGSQQSGGQHASGGTPALDDMDSQNRGESARDASQAFQQQDQQRDKR